MQRSWTAALAATAALPLVAGLLGGCSSSDPAPTTTATTSASPSASPSEQRNAAADAYCRGVAEFIAATQAAVKDPLKADLAALRRQSAELREQAEALPGQLIDDPDAIEQVQECTRRLQRFNESS